jgi:hypothetical protein
MAGLGWIVYRWYGLCWFGMVWIGRDWTYKKELFGIDIAETSLFVLGWLRLAGLIELGFRQAVWESTRYIGIDLIG